jgi:hypothetical protein
MQGSWRDGDRRPWTEVEALSLNRDDHPAVEYVVGLAPAGPVQRRCRPPISTMVSGETRIPPEYEPRLAEAEYSADEPHTFATLALRKEPVAKLSDLPDRERDRSARLNNVWRPLGLDRELRVLFLADGVCWGAAGMVRAGRDFTDRETEFVAAVALPITASA